jgi:hypothetical protein
MNSQKKRFKTSQRINIVLKDLPYDVSGNTVPNDDGSYTITINARHSYERQLKAYEHELRHVEQDYQSYVIDVNRAEQHARREPRTLKRYNKHVADVLKQLERARKHQAHKWLMNYIAEAKKREEQELLPKYSLDGYFTFTEADHYPDGAYEELKKKKII